MNEEPKTPQKKSSIERRTLVIWLAVASFTVILGNFVMARIRPMSDWPTAIGLIAGTMFVACLILIYAVLPMLRWMIWKKSFSRRKALVVLLAVVSFSIMLGNFVMAWISPTSDWAITIGIYASITFTLCLLFVYAGWPLLRWLFWKHWRGTTFTFACLFTMIALFYAEEDVRGKWAWNHLKREWEAKGERFDWRAFAPPPVPDDQNFALTPIVASSYETYFDRTGHELEPRNTNVVDRLSMMTWRDGYRGNPPKLEGWLAAQKTDLKAWQNYLSSSSLTNSSGASATNSFSMPLPPRSSAEEILQALSKYDANVEELRQACRLPLSRFPLTYETDNPSMILLPHLAAVKSAAQALSLRSAAELQLGQNEKAFDDLMLALRLTDSIRTEPFPISHLVRVSMVKDAFQPAWEGLVNHKWSGAQLTKLESSLAELDFLADYKMTIHGEIGFGSIIFGDLRRHPEQTGSVFSFPQDFRPSFAASLLFHLIPSGWFYQNQLRFARFLIQYDLPLADVEQHLVSPTAAKSATDELGVKINPYSGLAKVLLSWPVNAKFDIRTFAQAQSTVDLARLVCALERYRLAHGQYPETLDALAPRFIEKIPHDLIGGQPLHYRRTDEGKFLLYSVGWNEKDDGGTVVLAKGSTSAVDPDQGDWVWPMPAK